MPPDDFAALVDDIKKNGLRESGCTSDGMLLDGWHRYLACERAGQPFRHDEYQGSNRVAFVLSKNAHRRHLTASQRAVAVVACRAWLLNGSNQHKTTATGGGRAPSAHPPADAATNNGPATATTKEMAAEANVSERTITQAKAAQAAGLGDKVRDGTMSAKRAAEAAAAKNGAAKKAPARQAEKRTAPTKVGADDQPIAALSMENAALKAELEQIRDGMDDLRHDAEAAAELLKTEPAQLARKHVAEISRLTHQRDRYMNQCGELVKQVRLLERKLSKYEGARKAP